MTKEELRNELRNEIENKIKNCVKDCMYCGVIELSEKRFNFEINYTMEKITKGIINFLNKQDLLKSEVFVYSEDMYGSSNTIGLIKIIILNGVTCIQYKYNMLFVKSDEYIEKLK